MLRADGMVEWMERFIAFAKSMPSKVALFAITFYRAAISPLFPSCCRFTPTCSEYGYVAVQRFGFCKGSWLAIKRICRCHPGNPGGYDPVPEIEER